MRSRIKLVRNKFRMGNFRGYKDAISMLQTCGAFASPVFEVNFFLSIRVCPESYMDKATALYTFLRCNAFECFSGFAIFDSVSQRGLIKFRGKFSPYRFSH